MNYLDNEGFLGAPSPLEYSIAGNDSTFSAVRSFRGLETVPLLLLLLPRS